MDPLVGVGVEAHDLTVVGDVGGDREQGARRIPETSQNLQVVARVRRLPLLPGAHGAMARRARAGLRQRTGRRAIAGSG
jgi:hypothetical protein